jgi:ABC-2 type transport system ATP-binding protein
MKVNEDVATVLKKVRHQTILNIAVVGDQRPALKLLEGHTSIDKLDMRDHMIVATLKAEVIDYSDLATLLVQSGQRLTMFKEDELNLETAFMALTKGITS